MFDLISNFIKNALINVFIFNTKITESFLI